MVDTALFAFDIDGLENQRLVRPMDALIQMRALDAALARLSAQNGRASTCFTASEVQGETSSVANSMFFLPISHDARYARVDHVLIHAPQGFDAQAIEAFKRLRKIDQETQSPVIVVLVDIGPKAQFEGTFEQLCSSSTWRSKTPFVMNNLEHPISPAMVESAVQKELKTREGLSCVSVEIALASGRYQSVSEFRQSNDQKLDEPDFAGAFAPFTYEDVSAPSQCTRMMCNLRLRFETPVSGPLALGAWSRYGMGQFLPG